MNLQEQENHRFAYPQEWDDEFLSLWPHRYDYIWAEHTHPGQSPEWKTESRHPLADRLIRQGAYLYGVRFGALTNYCLIDIDAGSPYHPNHDPFAIGRILAALEPLGLISSIACTSSYSGGLHLYFPFEVAQKSYEVGIALQSLLQNAGFKPALGQLELFPNPKPYSKDHNPSLYAAHRLPMQAGSYLLNFDNDQWEMVGGNQATFVHRWQFAQSKNDLNETTLTPVVKAARRKQYCLSGKADKFLNDLNADIEPGWSDRGQTNFILGRITMRAYIFGHVLQGCEPLEGKALVDEIILTARSLPGYQDWCGHQHELDKRAEEWARCIEDSHYFHYGTDPKGKYKAKAIELSSEPAPLTWNQQQARSARERIREAIADLLNQDTLPATATARFEILTGTYRIGGQTLYKHRDLWHPACLWITPPYPLDNKTVLPPDSAERAPEGKKPKSFLYENGCNSLPHNGSDPDQCDFSEALDRNSSTNQGSGTPPEPIEGPQYIQQVLFEIQQRRQRERAAPKPTLKDLKSAKFTARKHAQAQRMRQYLDSGDPILMAEAMQWLAANPNALQE